MQNDEISDYFMDTSGLSPFLFIEFREQPKECIRDEFTRKMTALYRRARFVNLWGGHHTCVCKAESGNSDVVIEIHGQRMVTHSLVVHYISCHRDKIPSEV